MSGDIQMRQACHLHVEKRCEKWVSLFLLTVCLSQNQFLKALAHANDLLSHTHEHLDVLWIAKQSLKIDCVAIFCLPDEWAKAPRFHHSLLSKFLDAEDLELIFFNASTDFVEQKMDRVSWGHFEGAIERLANIDFSNRFILKSLLNLLTYILTCDLHKPLIALV